VLSAGLRALESLALATLGRAERAGLVHEAILGLLLRPVVAAALMCP
jgi:hypothetical protein